VKRVTEKVIFIGVLFVMIPISFFIVSGVFSQWIPPYYFWFFVELAFPAIITGVVIFSAGLIISSWRKTLDANSLETNGNPDNNKKVRFSTVKNLQVSSY